MGERETEHIRLGGERKRDRTYKIGWGKERQNIRLGGGKRDKTYKTGWEKRDWIENWVGEREKRDWVGESIRQAGGNWDRT